MRGMFWKALGLLGCMVFLGGCFETDTTVRNLQDKNTKLTGEVNRLQGENSRMVGDLTAAQKDRDVALADADRWREKADEFRKVSGGGNSGISPEAMRQLMLIAKDSRNWEINGTALRAQSDIFFDPGKAELKPQAKAAISEVAPKLKTLLADKSVVLRVDGHTDADPIKRTANLWKDNLHLSMMRAYAVVEALKAQGVPAESMCVAGWGEYRPVSADVKDKAKNRRVELTIVPAGQ